MSDARCVKVAAFRSNLFYFRGPVAPIARRAQCGLSNLTNLVLLHWPLCRLGIASSYQWHWPIAVFTRYAVDERLAPGRA